MCSMEPTQPEDQETASPVSVTPTISPGGLAQNQPKTDGKPLTQESFWRDQRSKGLTPSRMEEVRNSLPPIVPIRSLTTVSAQPQDTAAVPPVSTTLRLDPAAQEVRHSICTPLEVTPVLDPKTLLPCPAEGARLFRLEGELFAVSADREVFENAAELAGEPKWGPSSEPLGKLLTRARELPISALHAIYSPPSGRS